MTKAKPRRTAAPKPPRTVETSNRYEAGLLLMLKRGAAFEEIDAIQQLLLHREQIPAKYCDHKLNESKKWKNCRELHINPDWLLIYRTDEATLELIATGTHSDLY